MIFMLQLQGLVSKAHATNAIKLETKLPGQDQALLLVHEQLLLEVLLERSGFSVSSLLSVQHLEEEVDAMPAGTPDLVPALLVSNLTRVIPPDPYSL